MSLSIVTTEFFAIRVVNWNRSPLTHGCEKTWRALAWLLGAAARRFVITPVRRPAPTAVTLAELTRRLELVVLFHIHFGNFRDFPRPLDGGPLLLRNRLLNSSNCNWLRYLACRPSVGLRSRRHTSERLVHRDDGEVVLVFSGAACEDRRGSA